MADEGESRHVVRLACGHEALEVVPADATPARAGDWFLCPECRRTQPVSESFEVEP